jgi:hypothetical protein
MYLKYFRHAGSTANASKSYTIDGSPLGNSFWMAYTTDAGSSVQMK